MLKHLLAQHGINFHDCGVFDRLRASVANDAAVAASSSTVLSVNSASFHIKDSSSRKGIGRRTTIQDKVFCC